MRLCALTLFAFASIVIACSGGAPRPARTTAAPAPPAPVEAPPPSIPLEEDPAPDGPVCESTEACEEGRHCRGPAGCEGAWACGEPRECGEATISYCGCDELTFYALEGCPGRPYERVGPCEALGEEITEAEVEEVEGNTICTSDDDCRSGFVCAGTAGCGTFWTCVRRRSLGCGRDRAPFCSCNGETIFASSRCPGQPIAHEGYCAGDEPEPAATPAAEPPEPPTPSASSTPGPPASCMSSRDCPRGQVCAGAPGCGTDWHCERPRERCVDDTQYFCGCDGESFRASMTCPGRPHRHRGACARD